MVLIPIPRSHAPAWERCFIKITHFHADNPINNIPTQEREERENEVCVPEGVIFYENLFSGLRSRIKTLQLHI
jgi:hypothetical protein